MNILLSTTTGWNIGDEFIRYGVKFLLEQKYQNITYIYYDRNPDYFVDYPGNWEMGSGHFSNRMNNNIQWDIIDMVVLAGSPEFLHGPLTPIYEGLQKNPHIPLLCIGVGYSNPVIAALTDAEKEVLSRDSTVIIARQPGLELPKKPIVLPCPALFCHDYLLHDRQFLDDFPHKPIGVVVSAPEGNQRISPETYKHVINIDGDKLVHYIDDYVYLQKRGIKAYYNPEPQEFLTKLWEYKEVHTSRLHAGVAALSAHNKAIFYHNSHRITQALIPFVPVFMGNKSIYEFKDETIRAYLDILDKSF